MEIKKALRAIRSFSYVPKHAVKETSWKRRLSLPIFILVLALVMVGGGLWLTQVVERNIDEALTRQMQHLQGQRAPEEVQRASNAAPSEEEQEQVEAEVFDVTRLIPPVQGRSNLPPGWFKHPGYNAWQYHDGHDLKVAGGAKVRAMASGVVAHLEQDYDEDGLGPRGYRLQVEHSQGAVSEYIFPGELGVRLGEKIQAGEVLGTVSGHPGGEALIHIGLEQNGKVLDWLVILENRG
ncbi:MAG: M23 family metallopeptidase [Firmicutes bacterium]|nr:M23 family metallopeptidase [Bacillota bacterium]